MPEQLIDSGVPMDKPTFTAQDRCDRCGAQARLRAVLPVGELLFCSHHSREHYVQIQTQAIYVQELESHVQVTA